MGRKPSLAERIFGWPKAELHLHLEGSIEPDTVVELAARRGLTLALQEVAAHYHYADFRGFLESFKWVTSLIREPEDYALIAGRLVEKLCRQNVIYAEITLSAGVMLFRRQDVSANFAALRDAGAKARISGLRIQWVFDATRQFGAEKAMEVAWLAAQHRSGGVVAFGMGGDEASVPAEEFRTVFNFAREAGLHTVVHAGEIGGADEVRRAVEVLGAERIGHGIAAVEDAQVMELLAERRIPLEICPTSNLRTGALARLRGHPSAGITRHPIGELVRAGVPVTLSTDDPAMFGTNLAAEYAAAVEAGLTMQELAQVAEAGFAHAFTLERDREPLLTRLREALRGQGLLYSGRSDK